MMIEATAGRVVLTTDVDGDVCCGDLLQVAGSNAPQLWFEESAQESAGENIIAMKGAGVSRN